MRPGGRFLWEEEEQRGDSVSGRRRKGPTWVGAGLGGIHLTAAGLCPLGSSGLGGHQVSSGILLAASRHQSLGLPQAGGVVSQTGACGFQERRCLCEAGVRHMLPTDPGPGRGCLVQLGGSREPAGGREEGSLSKSPESRYQPFFFFLKQGMISCRWEGREEERARKTKEQGGKPDSVSKGL